MNKLTTKTVILISGLLLLISLSSCSGDEGAPRVPADKADASVRAEPVDVDDLAEAMDYLIYAGDPSAKDGGACFAEAAQNSGLSDAALALIVEAHSDDIGMLFGTLETEVAEQDAEILISDELRTQTDLCIATDLQPGKKDKTPAKPEDPEVEEPGGVDLEPVYTLQEGQDVVSAEQLQPGLVSTFESFHETEAEKKQIRENKVCLSETVIGGGFTQRTLSFLYGGARVTTGPLADHLPVKRDRELWAADEFLAKLAGCLSS